MDIQIQAGRDLVNQWVDVTVKGGAGQQIANVTTVLDGFPIGDDDLNPPEDSYERTWQQVGTGAPNQTHQVVVTVVDDKGNRSSASKTWQD
jgi:hypothetical protein